MITLAATRTMRFGVSAESSPGTSTLSTSNRIIRTRPSRSESMPHTGCINP